MPEKTMKGMEPMVAAVPGSAAKWHARPFARRSACGRARVRRGDRAARVVHDLDEKPRFLAAPADDAVPPQEGGDQPALGAVLLRWNVPDPAFATFQRACERILVTAEHPRDVV